MKQTGCMCLRKKEWEYGKILLLKVLKIRVLARMAKNSDLQAATSAFTAAYRQLCQNSLRFVARHSKPDNWR